MIFLSDSNSWNCQLSSLKGLHLPIVILPLGRHDELNASSLGASASLLVPKIGIIYFCIETWPKLDTVCLYPYPIGVFQAILP